MGEFGMLKDNSARRVVPSLVEPMTNEEKPEVEKLEVLDIDEE